MSLNLASLSFTDTDIKMAFIVAFYIVSLSIPLTWLAFALYFTGNQRFINLRNIILVSLVPLASSVMAAAYRLNGLVIRSYDVINAGDYTAVDNIYYGPWEIWVQVPYGFLFVFFSIFLLSRMILRSNYLFKWQIVLFIILQVLPIALGMMYLLNINPFPHLEYIPIVLGIGVTVTIIILLGSRHGEIMSLARRNILENIESSVIITDPEDKVIDVNQKTCSILGKSRVSLLEKDVNELLLNSKKERNKNLRSGQEITLKRAGKENIYKINFSIIKNTGNRNVGKAYILNDTTAEYDALKQLARVNRVLDSLSSVNRIIVRTKDRSKIIQDVCNTLVEKRGYYSAFITLFPTKNSKKLSAYCGDGKYFYKIKESIDNDEPVPCIEEVLKKKELVSIKDFDPLCSRCLIDKDQSRKGLFLAPLLVKEKPYGIISASIPRKFADSSEEISIFIEIANDVSFALSSLEKEESLDEERQKSDNYLRVAAIAILALDRKGNIELLNQKGREILEAEDIDLVGKNWFHIFVPDDIREKVWKRFKDIIEKRPVKNLYFEEPINTAKGRQILMAWHVSTVRDKDGNISGTLSSGEDITKKRETEKALQESEHFNSAILTNSPNPISVINNDRSIRFVNPAFKNITGYSSEELVGKKPPYPYWIKEVSDDYRKIIDMFFDNERNKIEIKFKNKKNNRFWVEASSKQILSKEGQLVYILQNWVDITERKQSMEKIRIAQEELKTSYGKVKKTLNDIIETLGTVVESSDQYTAEHQRKVSKLSAEIAKKMSLDKDRVEFIRVAGLIHDIGKINVPASILTKPGGLSDIEYKLIKTHPESGYNIIKGIDFPWPVAKLILQHHERLDGSGYPNNLKGDKIMLEAKIIAVSDVVEAMSSHRPYRPSLGIEKALEEINSEKGILYEPSVVDVCTALFRDKGFEF